MVLFQRHVHSVRTADAADLADLLQLASQVWRSFSNVRTELLSEQLKRAQSSILGSPGHIDGFLSVQLRPVSVAKIVAAAVGDNQHVPHCLKLLLSHTEQGVRRLGVHALVQVGYAPWLTDALLERGFVRRGWVISYRWERQPATPTGNRDVTVRPARPSDLPELLALDQRAFGPVWRKDQPEIEHALASSFMFSVATWQERIVGYQWCERFEQQGHLTRLAVHPDWEGRGVGTRLLTEAILAMTRSGITWITLNTQEDNHRSRRLYEQHGFRQIDHRVAVLWKDV